MAVGAFVACTPLIGLHVWLALALADAAAPQSALDVHRVAVVLYARACRDDVLRD